MTRLSILPFALFAALALPVHAEDGVLDAHAGSADQNLFVFGGAFQNEWVWETAAFWRDHYEDNAFFGIGYQNFFYDSDFGFKLGAELGVGARFGENFSTEVWGGVVLRGDGITFGDVTISPAITGGLSLVSDTIGVETERADNIGRDVPVLFYMGPELSIAHAALPDMEFLARIQHRSGGYGIIAEIDGSNAATMGVRFKF